MNEIEVFKQLGAAVLSPVSISTPIASPVNVPLQLQQVTPQGIWFSFDQNRGSATLSGTVKAFGSPNQPLHRRVILIEERSGNVIRETWSDAITGAYSFPEISPQLKYTVVAYDHTGIYSAVIADNLSATP